MRNRMGPPGMDRIANFLIQSAIPQTISIAVQGENVCGSFGKCCPDA